MSKINMMMFQKSTFNTMIYHYDLTAMHMTYQMTHLIFLCVSKLFSYLEVDRTCLKPTWSCSRNFFNTCSSDLQLFSSLSSMINKKKYKYRRLFDACTRSWFVLVVHKTFWKSTQWCSSALYTSDFFACLKIMFISAESGPKRHDTFI